MSLNPGRDAIAAGIANAQPYAGLNPVMAKQVQALVAASGGQVRLVSGHRTPEEQTALYNEAAARFGSDNANKWVADPASSNHVAGAAADFAGDGQLLEQLAPQFGLVAPMPWEPWHLEMASTPQHSSPDAYTISQGGEPNPTVADNSQNPAHVAASLAESLMGMTNTGGVGTAGSLANPAQSGDLANVLAGTPLTDTAAPAAVATSETSEGSTSAGGANIPGGKGNVAPTQLFKALTAAGLPADAAAAFTSIAGRESGYNTGAHNGNRGTGDDSYGLFQINLLNGGWTDFLKAHGLANPAQDLTTLQGSVKAAAAIYASSGLHPWGGYKGVPWWNGVDLNTGAQASGGAVTTQDMQALGGG